MSNAATPTERLLADPFFANNDQRVKDAVRLLLASVRCGTREKTLKAATGLPMRFIQECGERLRANGVWVDGKVCCDWAAGDSETPEIALLMDAMVALGLVERTTDCTHGRDRA